MSEEALNGLKVVVSEEEMTGKGVPESVWRNAFGDARTKNSLSDGALDVGFVDMIAAEFPGFTDKSELSRGEEPLPDEFPGGVFIFLFEWRGRKTPA